MAGTIQFEEIHGNKAAGTYVLRGSVETILVKRVDQDEISYRSCIFVDSKMISPRDCNVPELEAVSKAIEAFVSPAIVTKAFGEQRFRSHRYDYQKWYVTNFGKDDEIFHYKHRAVEGVFNAYLGEVREAWGEKKVMDNPIKIMLFRASLGDPEFDRDIIQSRAIKSAGKR